MNSQKFKVTKEYSYNKDTYLLYKNYEEYVYKLELSESTKDWRCKHIREFLLFCDNNNIKIKNIAFENVYDYMITINNYAERTREHRAVCIRLFLNYLKEKNIVKISGDDVFPEIKCYKETNVPSYYTRKEINKIINSINIKKENGKRDLAILLIFSNLGLRPRDVRFLKFNSIYWDENVLKILQSKTNYVNILPINDDIRYALIDYIKNERPDIDFKYVFVDNNGMPYNDHFYYNLVNKYLKKSGISINNRRHGTYIFRHSLAKETLDNGNGINSVANILGHSTMNDAKYYAKIDIEELKKIPLEVPKCKN